MSKAERNGGGVGDLSRRGRWTRYRPKISASVTTATRAASHRKPRESAPGASAVRRGRTPARVRRAVLFAGVVAEDLDREPLAQPPVKLNEELASLRFGHRLVRGALAERPVRSSDVNPRARGSRGAVAGWPSSTGEPQRVATWHGFGTQFVLDQVDSGHAPGGDIRRVHPRG